MELITELENFENLIENRIIGTPELNNSKICFYGKNNILVCENNIKFNNVVINFFGDNSLVYLCSDLGNFFSLVIYNNSTVFIGKDSIIGNSINLNVHESQNVIIGDDCLLSNQVSFFTADFYPIYESTNKKRMNFSGSIFIGDHVWLGRNSHISRGVKIGSGSIISDQTFISPNRNIKSNNLLLGNPGEIIAQNVFFVKQHVGNFKSEDTINSQFYKSNVFQYEFKNNETLNLSKINEIFNNLDVESRVEFIQKLFIKNKHKNRFYL